ncbi:MAG: FliH/SctL family protein [Armatimonadota bacterium]
MTAGGAQRWRWPSLDQVDEPIADFSPREDARQDTAPQAEADEAERMLRECRREAERLVEAAREQAEQIRREARSEAVEEVRAMLDASLREIVEEQTAAFATASEELLQRLEQARSEHCDRLERDLTGLVAMMAEKVIRRKVDAEDGIVLDVVRATIAQAAGAHRFTVRVPAPEEDLVRQAMAELLSVADGAEQMEIVADDAIGRGGCIVETERGHFDARIETQMEMLTEEIGRVTGEEESG